MSVWGTGGNAPRAEAFLDGLDHRISRLKGAHHRTSPSRPTDLPMGRAACLTTENHLRGRLPFRVTPALTYCGYAPNATRRYQPEGRNHHEAEVSTHRLGFAGPWSVREYPPVHPFDYACRPRLRTRLTRGRRTWPRNPWSSSGRDPHPSLATHVCILTPTKSTARLPGRFAPRRTLSYPATMKIAAASSVVCLSPATLSARNH